MKKKLFLILTALSVGSNAQDDVLIDFLQESQEQYDERMQWFLDAQYGMFIHFGLYSQLGGIWKGEEIEHYAEWIQAYADIAPQEYAMLTHQFNPKHFDADLIVQTARDAGMKYLVVTAKHHEGFCLWDSKYTYFDVANTPFKRDIIAELSQASKKYGLKFGTYYSIIDWHHPSQERNIDGTNPWGWWADIRMKTGRKKEYVGYMKNQLKELVENYDSDLMWFDANGGPWWDVETGRDLYQYVRSLKPSIIINNRVASKQKRFTKDYVTEEQSHPDKNLNIYWEACYTLNNSWGFKVTDTDWKTPQVVYRKLKDINDKGGNLLLNVGPDGHGVIPQKSVDILLEVGNMLNNQL